MVKRDSAEGKKLDEKAVKEYMAERLAKYKQLAGGVVFLDEIVSFFFGFFIQSFFASLRVDS